MTSSLWKHVTGVHMFTGSKVTVRGDYGMCRGPTESVSSSSSYSSMSVLMLSSRDSLSSSSQPTKNLGAPRRLSPRLLGSDITVPRGRPQGPAAASDAKTRRRRRGGRQAWREWVGRKREAEGDRGGVGGGARTSEVTWEMAAVASPLWRRRDDSLLGGFTSREAGPPSAWRCPARERRRSETCQSPVAPPLKRPPLHGLCDSKRP